MLTPNDACYHASMLPCIPKGLVSEHATSASCQRTATRFDGMNPIAVGKAKLVGTSATAVATLVIVLSGISSVAGARNDDDKAERKARELATIRSAVEQGLLVPLPRILELAQTEVPGDVVKTELEAKYDKLIYEIKILTKTGRVREVKLNASTGEVLSIEDD